MWQCNFQQTKVIISMMSLLTFSTCLVILCSLVYFLDYLWMASILFDVNTYWRFFSISKLVNWVINDPLIHKDLKNQILSNVVHMLLGLFMWLIFFKNRTHGFSIFFNSSITFAFIQMLNVKYEFLDSPNHFLILIHQTCSM